MGGRCRTAGGTGAPRGAASDAARWAGGRGCHLGKHLHFCTVDEGAGARAVQVCFEFAAFDGAAGSDAQAGRTPFPDTKSQLKAGDRVELACRLPLPGQSCANGADVPRVVWWRRAPRPLDKASCKKPSKRAAKQAASLARAKQRLAWAYCLSAGADSLGTVLLLPVGVVSRVGQIVGAPQRQRRVRRPASDQTGCNGSLRLAEKERRTGSPFGDRIAALALATYRERCAEFDAGRVEQTVVAAFVLRDERPETAAAEPQLTVVALGIGTKFMPPGSRRECPWHVRDSHAEVLARRSLLRYLYRELRLCYEHVDTASSSSSSSSSSIFRLVPGTARCCLRQGISFHLYSSTIPCGNASLSRWTSSLYDASVSHTDSGPHDFPRGHVNAPERVLFSARHEGQIAALIKGSLLFRPPGGSKLGSVTTAEPEPEQELKPELHTEVSQVFSCDRKGTVPPGCSAVPAGPDGMALVAGSPHYSLSCSDKIGRWQCLGLQGTLLMQFLHHPVYLQSCTFGRKFNRQRCERALCCRLQDFCPERCPELVRNTLATVSEYTGAVPAAAPAPVDPALSAASGFRIHHAAMLGTSLLLDPDSVVGEVDADNGNDTGAKFSAVCGAWTLGDPEAVWHDGRSGCRRSSEEQPEQHMHGHTEASGSTADGDGAGEAPRWAVPIARAALHRLFRDLAAIQAQTVTAAGNCCTNRGNTPRCEVLQARLAEYTCYTKAKVIVGEATGVAPARQLLLFGQNIAKTPGIRPFCPRSGLLTRVCGFLARQQFPIQRVYVS